ncbi:MAG: co-chaperone GroES family protein [Candidatus Gygaella obscura]|nr:co-chaperone GroES family protein [Candidatus Gygaella obscura]
MKKELIVIGDKVLISVYEGSDKTDFGLYLPQGIKEKEKVAAGLIVKSGPGYPVWQANTIENEDWKQPYNKEATNYIALQAKEGDYCIFLRDSAVEVRYEKKKYVVVPHSAILLLVRGDIDKAINLLEK